MRKPPPGVRFRAGTPGDGIALLELHQASIRKLGRSAYTEAEVESWAYGLQAEGYREAMESGENFILAVDADDRLLGFCSHKGDEVIGLYVAPDHARCGIGSALLRATEAAITKAGHARIRIGAALSAVEFYQAHGYELVRYKDWPSRGGLIQRAADFEKEI